MATETIFFTGFPGFLGVELLPRVLRRAPDAEAVCLVQSKFHGLAQQRVEELEKADPDLTGRIRLVDGDITSPDLGLGHAYDELAGTTTEVFHLAAVYDLAVAAELALKVNVDGTRHVTDFAGRCDDLRRYQYVSTCYVSGRYAGPWREDDLQVAGQVFNNHYEETKHLAEIIVREAMASQGLPTTIYRPSVVAGDSRTGATQKYDGPYFVARLLMKQPKVAVVPMVGDPGSYRFNFVPRDFVVDAMTELSGRDDTAGKCFALADPKPLTIAELIETFATAADKKLVTIPVTRGLAKGMLRYVPGMDKMFEMPEEALDYFTHPTHYLTDNTTAALAGTGIEIPDIRTYVGRLVEFVRANPTITSAAMV
jgi:thioester reductase-like protein